MNCTPSGPRTSEPATAEKKQSIKVANLITRSLATCVFIWICTQIYFLSVTGNETKGTVSSSQSNPKIEEELTNTVNGAIAIRGIGGEAPVLDARKQLLDYYLRTWQFDKAEKEAGLSRDEALASTTLSVDQKVAYLSDLAGMMRDTARFFLAVEIYNQTLAEIQKSNPGQSSEALLLREAAQHNNLGVTYFLWSQTSIEPASRREKLEKAKEQNRLCAQALSKVTTTSDNRIQKQSLTETVEANRQIYEEEIIHEGGS